MDYIKAMFGPNAVHVGFNCVIQQVDDCRVSIIGQSYMPNSPHPLLFGSQKIHQLILGDAVIRPRQIIESDHLRGQGMTAIAMYGMADIDEWAKNGNVLLGTL
jgi:hypothetical protein